MTALTLNLSKPGEKAAKLLLNLQKNEVFTVKLMWDDSISKTDLDLHALLCKGSDGGQASITTLEQILSTYNVRRTINGSETGTIDKKADGTFDIFNGALVHSVDATDGKADGIDEWIRVDPSKIPKQGGEYADIPLIAMIHPQSASRTFKDVQNATVTIENARGEVLLSANLSSQFANFVGVQMGSIMIDANGKAEFIQVGTGFQNDFNDVIAHFG